LRHSFWIVPLPWYACAFFLVLESLSSQGYTTLSVSYKLLF
jgi:hypothetical protein